MHYYPLLLDLKDKRCAVVGGGLVAQRKVYSLLKAKAKVEIISPELASRLKALKVKRRIRHIKSSYRKGLIRNSFLVIAATSQKAVNSQVSRDARRLGILVNVVDSGPESDFLVPSSLQKQGLIISISTCGQAPCLSKRIRQDLEKLLVPEYAEFLQRLKKIRQDLKLRCLNPELRSRLMNTLAGSKL